METHYKQGYKQTEVGLIPEEWEVKSIKQVAPLQRGFDLPTKDLKNGPFPVVYSNGIVNYHNKFQAKKPGVVTGRSGTIGKITYLNQDFWPHNTSLWVTNFFNNNPKFIFYLFSSIKIERFSSGSGVPTLNRNDVHDFLIPLPPLPEQTAIASALSDMDALIAQTEKLIEKKKAIKQGVMQELLKPKEGWGETCLFELAEGKKNQFDDGDWIESEFITDKGVRLIQTGNIGVGKFLDKASKKYISEESFNKLNCKEVLQGDLLVCRLAEPAGRACVMPYIGEEKVITSVDVSIFRGSKEKVNREFLSQIFTTQTWFQKVLEKVGGTTHKRISRGALGKIKLMLPTLQEQNTIAEILSDMDLEILAFERRVEKLKLQKQGIMQALLTGQIRLV